MRHRRFGSSMNKKWQAKIYFTCQKKLRLAGHIFSLLRAPELKDIGNKKLV